ncbi:MAG: 5-formyltetrahydrofolate cyclo-ligase [Luteolibacter sp.]
MAIPESFHPKSALRKSMRQLLHELNASSQAVCDALHEWLCINSGLKAIAVFSPLPGEVDLENFINRHPEITWAYPRVHGDTLTFHAIADPAAELTHGSFGIMEASPIHPLIPEDQIDAFLCPGLAFDSKCGRLGRGKGFYDRILAKARPDAQKIGVCFPCQQVPDTFPEPHDIPMDAVICGRS